ncbi:hypothetical protein NDU88_001682 [Pleurodeles waltl]|uniref:Uncharacterized protein n=1 Tax=Pleurodeles waltl TaxID=8319 RepID=A0AAV7WJ21_PLEWA|nr:hypothetical protein NDU88_001682 [Pleurodeles waltl]
MGWGDTAHPQFGGEIKRILLPRQKSLCGPRGTARGIAKGAKIKDVSDEENQRRSKKQIIAKMTHGRAEEEPVRPTKIRVDATVCGGCNGEKPRGSTPTPKDRGGTRYLKPNPIHSDCGREEYKRQAGCHKDGAAKSVLLGRPDGRDTEVFW